MNINPKIKTILRQHNINEDHGLVYLLALYHNLNIVSPEETTKQINLTKIVERNYESNGEITWKIPLYEGEDIDEQAWNWVITEFRPIFGELRADAIGNKKDCVVKMKKFFAAHPDIRKDDVIRIAQRYVRDFRSKMKNPTDAQYFQRADYFISKIVKAEGGTQHGSRLEMYWEMLKAHKAGENATVVKPTHKVFR